MQKQFAIFILLTLFLSCEGQQTLLQAVAFSDKIKTTETKNIIDVRTPDEFNEGYIKNAKNINWNCFCIRQELLWAKISFFEFRWFRNIFDNDCLFLISCHVFLLLQ